MEHLSYRYCPGAIALPAERLVINLWFFCPVQFAAPGSLFFVVFLIFTVIVGLDRHASFVHGQLGLHHSPHVRAYLIFHDAMPDRVRLLRVLHGARDLQAELGK